MTRQAADSATKGPDSGPGTLALGNPGPQIGVVPPGSARPGRAHAKESRGRSNERLTAVVAPFCSAVVAIGIWYLISYVFLESDKQWLVPPPHEVLNKGLLEWEQLEPKLDALMLTARVALTGLVIAVAIGVSVAVLMSRARWLERSLYPYAVILQTVPILAIVPLIGMWFGFSMPSRTVVCVIIALFPMIANTLFGIQSVNREHHDLFTLQRATRWNRLIKLELPAALPSIFTGLRTSAGLSVIGAVVGDMFFRQGEPGIGTLLDVYRQRLQSADVFASIILASLFGVVVFFVFSAINRLAVGSWHGSGTDR